MAKTPDYEFKNLTKSQQDCLTLIESLGIYELRALARVFGDNSPTTLKRNDHIVIVMNKIISGEDLRPIPLRQGRPYKELSNIEGILAELSQITGKDYTLKSNQQRATNTFSKLVTFKQPEDEVIKQKLFPIEVRGILCEKNDRELYLVNEDNGRHILVKKDIESRLKPYDYVAGTAIVMNEEKEYILDSIKVLNYQNYNTYKETHSDYEETLPTEKIKFNGQEITLGSRYLLKTSKFIESEDKIKSLLTTLRDGNIVKLALIPNVLYEDFLTLNSFGFHNALLLKYDESAFSIYEMIMLFIGHVKRLQSLGYKVAMFVQDIPTIANAVDFAFKNNTKALMGHTENAVGVIKQLVMLAKAGGENKHTTLFTTLDEADMFDQMFISSVYKVSKKIDV